MIAAQLYTIRDKLVDPSKVRGVLGRLREIGYRAVEAAGLGPKTVESFGQELAHADLVACAAHFLLPRLNQDLDGVVAQCREWDCRYVVLPDLPKDYHSAEGYRRFAAEAPELASRLSAHGLQLVYHNHNHELERDGQKTWLESLFAAVPPDALKAELDTYWLQYGGANPSEWIRRFKGRVPLVHLKDMAVHQANPVQVEVGEGNLNWVEILGACCDAGAEWLVVEQDESMRDSMESLAISYANLGPLMAKAGLEV